MKVPRRFLLLTPAALACSAREPAKAPRASAPPPPAVVGEQWLTKLGAAHPLVGKVWDVRSNGFVTQAALATRVAQARFVLLGERHDNPDHHRLQARVLQHLVSAGRKPAVVLEMVEVEQQATIDALLQQPDASAAQFGAALGWEKTSWPPYAEYQPILEVAFAARLPIIAGNLAQADAKALVKQGAAALPEPRAKELRLAEEFPAALEQALHAELRDSHCGHLPERLLAPMALAQHARDAQLARSLALAGAADGAVLIAGAGHVRQDRGVPHYLRLEAPGASVLSVAAQEVDDQREQALDYVAVHPHASAPFDYLWFTPRASDEDPCAAFKTK